jgi:hypothetical protein
VASCARVREHSFSGLGALAYAWGVGGVCLLLASAVFRLLPLAFEPVRAGMSALEWAAYVGSIAFMAYTEGHRGFGRSFSPRVVARALWLRQHPRPLLVALAPLFCMAFFHASRVRLVVAWTILIGVVALVLGVRGLDQPWRGIVDAGVVVGLSWGLFSIAANLVRARQGRPPAIDPRLPAGVVKGAEPG